MVGEAATIEAESIEAAGYELGDTLGEGRFSQVVRATHLASGEQYAVKIVDLESIAEDEEALEALQVELSVLKAARHPNIVGLQEVVNTPEATYVIMELIAGGELFDEIVARGTYTEPEARELLQSLLSALAFCNEIGVVHRDLKPENILLDRSGPQPVLKLIDFGCVCHPALAPPDGDDTRGGAPFAHTRAGASRAGTPRWSTPGNG